MTFAPACILSSEKKPQNINKFCFYTAGCSFAEITLSSRKTHVNVKTANEIAKMTQFFRFVYDSEKLVLYA